MIGWACGPVSGSRSTEQGGRVILEKVVDDDAILRVYGMLTLPDPVDQIIDEMRGPAVLPPET